jgi:E3 ubiquitin-protein ligase ATL41
VHSKKIMSLSSNTNSLPYSTDKGGYSTHDTLVLLAIGFCATAVSVLIIVLCECLCCRRRRRGPGGTVVYVAARPFFLPSTTDDGDGGLSPSAVSTLPSFVFRRGLPVGGGSGRGEGSGSGSGRGWAQCAVCLSLVQEGEVVRRLPACTHLFHVCCIDMWLHSHSTCPLCRATVLPTKEVPSNDPQPPV